MTADEFKRWRRHLHLSQKNAAFGLGISLRQLQNYEHGISDVPKTVSLACLAIAICDDIEYRGPGRVPIN